jgi:hypothetical protein
MLDCGSMFSLEVKYDSLFNEASECVMLFSSFWPSQNFMFHFPMISRFHKMKNRMNLQGLATISEVAFRNHEKLQKLQSQMENETLLIVQFCFSFFQKSCWSTNPRDRPSFSQLVVAIQSCLQSEYPKDPDES